MNKLFSLIKVNLNHDMNIFKIHTKKNTKLNKIIIPLILTLYLMFIVGTYATKLISILKPLHLEFIILTLFATAISFITLMEGIYKSGTLLFNCKDDDLMFSLPIKKRTILFVRIFKFYIFEFMYNSLFLLPAIIVYAYYMQPNWTYYLISVIALFILPIIPIVISCFIGFFLTSISSKFKKKNVVQTIFTMTLLLIIMYISYNMKTFTNNIVSQATNINDILIKIYYPVGKYISLVNSFNIKDLLEYIFFHLIIFFISIFILGKLYFKINSSSKKTIIRHEAKPYKIKQNKKITAFIKKEINRFITTPVFITNAGFGLVLFIAICILGTIKFNSIAASILITSKNLTLKQIEDKIPLILLAAICFTSLMTSITSCMISLENKSFNILKSLPLKSIEIVIYKVAAAIIIMIPCILIGDTIIFIKFSFNWITILLLLISSIILPIVSSLIGIIVNLKYPKLDATNDTEVVKQSLSSMISVFIGLGLIGITGILIMKMIDFNINNYIIILLINILYSIICFGLWIYLKKNCDKSINNINS